MLLLLRILSSETEIINSEQRLGVIHDSGSGLFSAAVQLSSFYDDRVVFRNAYFNNLI